MSNDLYEAHFSWPETHPSSVIVTGSFDHWSWSTPLTKGPSDFYGTVKVPWGQRIEYKYIVDGNWCTAWNQPTVFDPLGNLNNYFISPSKPEPVPEPEPEPEMQPTEPAAPAAAADTEKKVEETRPESAPETDDVVDTEPTTTAAAEEPAQPTGSRPLVNLIPVNDTSADIVPTSNEIETHSPVGNLPTTRRSLETLASPPPGPEPVEKPTEEATPSSTSPVANTTQPAVPARASSSRSLVNLIPVNDTSADIIGSPDNDIATHTPVGALTPRSVEPPTTTTDVAAAESPEPIRPRVAHSRSVSSRSLVALIPVNDTSSDIIGSLNNEIATHTPIRTTSGVESPAPAAVVVESPVPSKPVVQPRKSSSRSLVALIPVNDTSADIISSPDNEIVTHTPVRAQTPRSASNGAIESPSAPTRPSVESRKSSSRSLVALIPVNDTSADVVGSPDHEIVTHTPVDTQARRSPPPPKSAPEPEAPVTPAASAPANETPSEPARAPSPRTLVNLIPVNDTSADIITNPSDDQGEITTHAPISARAAAAPKSQEQSTPAPASAKPAETTPTPSAAPSLPSTPVKQPSQTRKEAQQPSTSDDGTDTVTVVSSSTTSTPLKPTASSTASAKQQQQSPPSASPKRFGSLRGSSTGSSLNLKRRSFIARVKSVFVPGHHGGDGEKDKDSHRERAKRRQSSTGF